MTGTTVHPSSNTAIVKTLTYLMFTMFAMTTDSVGLIIPEVIRTFQLSLTAAGTFQYATMAGIAIAGLFLGQLADRFGRRRTIVIGLTLFAAACFLLAAGNQFLSDSRRKLGEKERPDVGCGRRRGRSPRRRAAPGSGRSHRPAAGSWHRAGRGRPR